MANEKDQFAELTQKTYKQQAIWFLNGFWVEVEKEAEQIWKYTRKFEELDPKKKTGCDLDEFWSHKFLESWGETLTVIKLREMLKKIDLDVNGRMSAIEYFCFRYAKSIPQVVKAPQGSNTEELKKAQQKLDELNDALDKLKKAEADLAKSQEELRVAIAETKAQQDAQDKRISDLTAKSNDSSATQVTRSKAAMDLAAAKQEDPLPLRRSKLTQEAALRKVERNKKEVAEDLARTQAALKDAQDYLDKIAAGGGDAKGAMWYLKRELVEANKYLPKSKQKEVEM